MKRVTRIALGTAGLALGIALAPAAPAGAQVRFEGSFPVPFGRVTVGVPAPFFSIGAFVPFGYVVVNDPYYGYGFVYGDQWISCQPYGSRWVIVSRRPFYGYGGYGYGRYGRHGYGYGYGYGYAYRSPRGSWGHDDRRTFARDDHRFRDDRRSDRRNDRRSDRRSDGGRDDGRRWNR